MFLQILPNQLGNVCLVPSTTTYPWSIITTYIDSNPTFKFILQTVSSPLDKELVSIHGPICYKPLDPNWTVSTQTDHIHPLTYSTFDIHPIPHALETVQSVSVSILYTKPTHQSLISASNTDTFSLLLPSLLNNIVVGGAKYMIETGDFLFRVDTCTPNKPGRISAAHTTITYTSSLVTNATPSSLVDLKELTSYKVPAGLESEFSALHELVAGAFHHAHIYSELNTRPPTGVLIHGPPGVGKTWLVTQVCRALKAQLHVLTVDTIISPFPGQSQSNLRTAFAHAYKTVESGVPTVILLDEIEVLAPNRTNVPGMASVVAQLLTLLDGMQHKRSGSLLIVIGATNRPNAIDPAVRRFGRLDREVRIGPPNALVRQQVLRSLLASIPTDPMVKSEVWLSQFADCLPGYVGADLSALVREACHGFLARKRTGSNIGGVVTCQDLCLAQTKVPPSLRRGYHISFKHKSSWDDIGGLDDVKQHIIKAAIWPTQRTSQFKALGISNPKGLLLYGPPGCSKTSLVRILATQTNASFYHISPADIYSAHVGEGERIVRDLFTRARSTAPSVLFIDEIDALVGGDRASDDVKYRLLLTLLAEMDGVSSFKGVLVVAATNYPDKLDPALVRPGRLDQCVYVRPPSLHERVKILEIVTRHMPLDTSVNLETWAEKMPFASGADLTSIAREVALACLRQGVPNITNKHFDHALELWHPVITTELLAYYDAMQQRFRT